MAVSFGDVATECRNVLSAAGLTVAGSKPRATYGTSGTCWVLSDDGVVSDEGGMTFVVTCGVTRNQDPEPLAWAAWDALRLSENFSPVSYAFEYLATVAAVPSDAGLQPGNLCTIEVNSSYIVSNQKDIDNG